MTIAPAMMRMTDKQTANTRMTSHINRLTDEDAVPADRVA
jgi:hypothetical protein